MKVENALAHDFLNDLLNHFEKFGWKQGLGYGPNNEACLVLRMASVRYGHPIEVTHIAVDTMLTDSAFHGFKGTKTERLSGFNDDIKTTWEDVNGVIERTKMRLRGATELEIALEHPVWFSHRIGDLYAAKGCKGLWKFAYYPIFCDGKTNEPYNEPRALMEQPINDGGTDFREMPLRYIKKQEQ